MYFRPVCLQSSTICLQSAMRVAMGTVQATCLPALSAAMAIQAVVGDGRVDVDGVDVRILEQFLVIGVALRDAEVVADRVELGLGLRWQMAYMFGVRMALVDGDELGPEAEADDGDVDL